jgi:hypothetical protein
VFPALLTTLLTALRAATWTFALRATLAALTWTVALLLGPLFRGLSRILLLSTLAHSTRLLPALLLLLVFLLSHGFFSSAVYSAERQNSNRCA